MNLAVFTIRVIAKGNTAAEAEKRAEALAQNAIVDLSEQETDVAAYVVGEKDRLTMEDELTFQKHLEYLEKDERQRQEDDDDFGFDDGE